MKKSETYICTRSRLAGELITAGQSYEETVNPWHPERKAWIFPLTPTVVTVAANYYSRNGQAVPEFIRNAAEAMGVEV